MGWKLYQMDAKTTFLNDIVDTLLLGIRSMIKAEEYFPRSRKLHHEYTEEIRNVGLQVHSYSGDVNLKKSRDSASDSNLIDPTMYCQLIGSLMYLTNTRPDICFVVNALS